MIANEKPDDLLRALASLASPAPAAARDARTLERCHGLLSRARAQPSPRKVRSWLTDGILAIAVSAYGTAVVVEALKVFSVVF